ncbi:MAG: alpha/beta fold hydrolase [Gammaproteobacteria bacterium]|nr:alpha/beta fold hydrolase [Gammaproteobacteria bacterium]
MIKKISSRLMLVFTLLFAGWYYLIALKEQPMELMSILAAYEYQQLSPIDMRMKEMQPGLFEFSYTSFDGQRVIGQIGYPETRSASYPVLLGVPAMGHSYIQWWVDSIDGRPSDTQVDKITELANRKGYVVIAIDPRFHGKREDPARTLRSIMNDLHFFGDKSGYEAMVRDTVIDYCVLLDWIETQPELDASAVVAAGYSMGGQVSLLLGAVDQRINRVISIVPPYLDDKTALVAPKNLVQLFDDKPVLLVTANSDKNATASQNKALFEQIKSKNKRRINFTGGHILPENYVERLADWF